MKYIEIFVVEIDGGFYYQLGANYYQTTLASSLFSLYIVNTYERNNCFFINRNGGETLCKPGLFLFYYMAS